MNFIAQKIDTINLGNSQPAGISAKDPTNTLSTVLTNAITIIFVLGAIAVVFFVIWGAFNWIISGGDKEKVASARKTITNALIGLALLALAFLIISVVGTIVGFNPLKNMTIPALGNAANP